MGKVSNIEYGNIDYKKVIIENGNIEFNFENGNIDSQTGSPVGGGGVTADDDRGCYDPVWPRFTDDVTVFEVKFDVTVTMVSI